MTAKDALFDYVLVITLQGRGPAAVTYRFPPASEGRKDTIANSIVQFCFPDEAGDVHAGSDCETFSFVLTEGDGSKRFAYCRRFKLPNKSSECFCIISWIPSFNLFSQVLDVVEERRQQSSSSVFVFLKSVLANPFPAPGASIEVTALSTTGNVPDRYTLSRPCGNDFLLDYITFGPLFSLLSIPNIIHLFASLLLERRVIICSSNLTDLSACVNGINALLNPFTWQHVFIPVLPKTLLEYCSAPMPFFVGILSSYLPALKKIPMEEVLLVDLQKSSFLQNPDEDTLMLPLNLTTSLVSSLNGVLKAGLKSRAFDLAIARVFLKAQMQLFSDYPRFMRGAHFDEEGFIHSQPKENQPFLKRFQESQLFESFVREREIMSADGKLGECIFVREKDNPQLELLAPGELFCWKCAENLSSDVVIKRGVPYCKKCASNGSFLKSLFEGLHDADDRVKSKLEGLRLKVKSKRKGEEGDGSSNPGSKTPSSVILESGGDEAISPRSKKGASGERKNLASQVASFFTSDKEKEREKDYQNYKSSSPSSSGIYQSACSSSTPSFPAPSSSFSSSSASSSSSTPSSSPVPPLSSIPPTSSSSSGIFQTSGISPRGGGKELTKLELPNKETSSLSNGGAKTNRERAGDAKAAVVASPRKLMRSVSSGVERTVQKIKKDKEGKTKDKEGKDKDKDKEGKDKEKLSQKPRFEKDNRPTKARSATLGALGEVFSSCAPGAGLVSTTVTTTATSPPPLAPRKPLPKTPPPSSVSSPSSVGGSGDLVQKPRAPKPTQLKRTVSAHDASPRSQPLFKNTTSPISSSRSGELTDRPQPPSSSSIVSGAKKAYGSHITPATSSSSSSSTVISSSSSTKKGASPVSSAPSWKKQPPTAPTSTSANSASGLVAKQAKAWGKK